MTLLLIVAALQPGIGSVADDGGPRKVALLVGVNEYAKPGFSNLSYAEADVESIGAALADLGFEIEVLPGSKATRERIEKTARSLFSDLGKDDVAVVMLSGHGVHADVVEDGAQRNDAFYCPYDAVLGRTETLLSLSLLTDEILAANVGSSFLLVDACRNDPGWGRGRSVRGIDGSRVSLPEGVAILFSCSRGQLSWELPQLQHGLFSYCVIEALRGAAGHGGVIEWDSVEAHVKRRMSSEEMRRLLRSDALQTPISAGGAPYSRLGVVRFDHVPGRERADNCLLTRLVYCPPVASGTVDSAPEPAAQHSNREGFWIGRFEVTQSEWSRLMKTEPWRRRPYSRPGRQAPATYVSWDDAAFFCERLTEYERRERRLSATECYRLPTEAEWEHACLAGVDTPWWFGPEGDENRQFAHCLPTKESDEHGLLVELAGPRRVGLLTPNPWGLHDTHGNVAEWCAPPIRSPGSARSWVARGGAWSDISRNTSAQSRQHAASAATPSAEIGFRVLRGKPLLGKQNPRLDFSVEQTAAYSEVLDQISNDQREISEALGRSQGD